LLHFFKGVLFSLSIFCPIWCAIIFGNPHCAILNYLGPVAPCRSIRDGKIRSNHAELHRTGWLYCTPYCKIAESAESTERRRKPQKGQKAQKGAEMDFWGWSAKKSVQVAAAQPVVDNGRLVCSRLAT
jgi:hypothetical protein